MRISSILSILTPHKISLSDSDKENESIIRANDIRIRTRSTFWWTGDLERRKRQRREDELTRELRSAFYRKVDERTYFNRAERGLFWSENESVTHYYRSIAKGVSFGFCFFALRRFGRIPPGQPWFASPEGHTGFLYWFELSADIFAYLGCPSLISSLFFQSINEPVLASLHSKIPLVPGTSEFCRNMCPDVIATAEQISQNKHKAKIWDNPQTVRLEEMKQLVLNCKRRVAFEDSRRQAYGLSRSQPVYVPVPGVPKWVEDIPLPKVEADRLTTDREEE